MSGAAVDIVYLAKRERVVASVIFMLSAAAMAGANRGALKAAVVALRSPDVGLILPEEAEGILQMNGLGGE